MARDLVCGFALDDLDDFPRLQHSQLATGHICGHDETIQIDDLGQTRRRFHCFAWFDIDANYRAAERRPDSKQRLLRPCRSQLLLGFLQRLL